MLKPKIASFMCFKDILKPRMTTFKQYKDMLKCCKMKVGVLRVFMKGMDLSNKVKKKVISTLTRMEVERSVERAKHDMDEWCVFIGGFIPADWETVGEGCASGWHPRV